MLVIAIDKAINVSRLIYELRQQFPEAVASWDQSAALVYVERIPEEELSAIQAILDAHDHALEDPAQVARDRLAAVEASSEASAAAVPGWASWTEEHALDWIAENIEGTVPAPVLTWIIAITRLAIAQRNAQWPNLQEE